MGAAPTFAFLYDASTIEGFGAVRRKATAGRSKLRFDLHQKAINSASYIAANTRSPFSLTRLGTYFIPACSERAGSCDDKSTRACPLTTSRNLKVA